MQTAKQSGLTDAIGIANSVEFGAELRNLVPDGFVIQCAAPPALFGAKLPGPSNDIIFHSVVKSFLWKRSIDNRLERAMLKCGEKFHSVLGDEETIPAALAFVLLGSAAPSARLIFATARVDNLVGFLRIISNITVAAANEEIFNFFRNEYGDKDDHLAGTMVPKIHS
jgi:hypothetical protein